MIEKIKKIFGWLMDKYQWLLSLLLKIDHVQLKRERFVRTVVHRYCKDNEDQAFTQAMETSLATVISAEQQDHFFKKIKRRFGTIVFITSFVTCFPEGIVGMVIAVIIDLAIFQACLYIAMQQIMQLYGQSSDYDDNEEENVSRIIAIESSGLMLGKYPLLQKMKTVVGWLSRQLVKYLGPKYMAKASRLAFQVIRRQGIKWFSIIVAKEHVTMVFDLIVPVTCAVISGFVSVIIFIPMCNKLKRHLQQNKSNVS